VKALNQPLTIHFAGGFFLVYCQYFEVLNVWQYY